MNKKGHLFVTEVLLNRNNMQYGMWLKIGSILPDILVHTYLVGHTWEKTFDKTAEKMMKLEKTGKMNRRSCLMLGYLLHYIEDYFTFPHNTYFTDGFIQHIRYEKSLTGYLKETEDSPKELSGAMSGEFLIKHLRELHEKYEQETTCVETDEMYIFKAGGCVMYNYSRIFEKNLKETEMPKHNILRPNLPLQY
ncbi:MAG: zinc dependent phospholipase C family protein [Lachnospiraceae bacterium]|nr:zinc dependent phospholipase C family protein [Lachnospiraceae bacterium]